jgi:hypothetical protein
MKIMITFEKIQIQSEVCTQAMQVTIEEMSYMP